MQNTKLLFTKLDKSFNVSHIHSKARELAKQLGSISYESVISFAESHFIQVRFIGFPSYLEHAFGYSDVRDGIRYIHVNRNTSECQMTFTILHELGHLLLDHYPVRRPSDLLELEAIFFAFFVYSSWG